MASVTGRSDQNTQSWQMRHQPDFERLRTALLCGQPDRVPLAELQVDIKDAYLGKPVTDAATNVEFWAAAGYDYTIVFPFATHAEELFAGWETSCCDRADGSQSERRWAPEGAGPITNQEQFEEFDWPDASVADYALIEQTAAALPAGMGLICSVGGLWEFVRDLMGFEVFSLALADDPELVSRMFDRVGELVYSVFLNIMDHECVDAIWFCDDIAYTGGLTISPDVLRRHVFPNYKRMAGICRDRGLPVIYHSDGDLRQMMDDLIDVGINALHPIEPKAMDISELKRELSGVLCLIGNIDLGYTLTRGTPEDVEREVRQKIEQIAPGGGYCLGSSNSIPDYVPLENYRAMIESALKYGRY